MDFRKLFPIDPSISFLNHGSLGLAPTMLWDRVHALNLEAERNPIDMYDRQRVDRLRDSREALADFVDAEVDELMVVPNATYAVNAILKSLTFKRGDEIVLTNLEYGAYKRLFQEFKERDECTLVEVDIPYENQSREQLLSSITNKLSDRTKLVFVSHITASTGHVLPVKEICAAASKIAAISVIDGAHVPGHLPLSVREVGADCYIGNCHKWLFAPRSSAFFTLSPKLQKVFKPLIVSWGEEMALKTGIPFIDEFSWRGTVNWSSIFAIPDATEFYHSHNMEKVGAECSQLAESAMRELCTLPGLEPVSTDGFQHGIQLFSLKLPFPAKSVNEVCDFLSREKKIEVQIGSLGDQSRMRVSVNCYNTSGDIDRLIEAMKVKLS